MHEIILGGTSNYKHGLKIVDWTRPITPEIKDDYQVIDGVDGLRHKPKELGNRIITVRFFKDNIDVKDWMSQNKEISKWLYSKGEIKIKFDDEPEVYYIGKVTEADLPENYKPAISFWVTLNCHSFKYGADVDEEIELIANEESFMTQIENEGNYETPFDIEVIPKESIPSFAIYINGNKLMLNKRITEDDILTISSKSLEVRVNDALVVDEFEGYFSFLRSGENTLKTDSDVEITVCYRERNI